MLAEEKTLSVEELTETQMKASLVHIEDILLRDFRAIHAALWFNPDTTPKKMFDQLGSKGLAYMMLGKLTLDYMTAVNELFNDPCPDLSAFNAPHRYEIDENGQVRIETFKVYMLETGNTDYTFVKETATLAEAEKEQQHIFNKDGFATRIDRLFDDAVLESTDFTENTIIARQRMKMA